MMTREGLVLPQNPVTDADLRRLGINPVGATEIPVRLDRVDAFGMTLISDADSVFDAIWHAVNFAGGHMPVGWRPKLPTEDQTHVKPQVNGVTDAKNGVSVNPRSAQKWATVARIAEYFAANPRTDIKTGAAELGISERHVYRVLVDVIGVKQ